MRFIPLLFLLSALSLNFAVAQTGENSKNSELKALRARPIKTIPTQPPTATMAAPVATPLPSKTP
jgi:hypothetical protein